MNVHLSQDQISQWISGDRSGESARHLEGCAACSDEVTRLESALAGFRESVQAWPAPPPSLPHPRSAPRVARWVLAAAVLAATVAAPVYWRHRAQAQAARADATLLQQVDAEVSEAVPSPMQPLVQLVSWNASAKESGETQ